MGITDQEAIREFHSLMDKVDDQLMNTFQNMHQGFPSETLTRFLKARDWNVAKAHKMKPIFPTELYRSIRDTQLVGLSGHSKQGLPVVACGVGQSTYDKASVHYYVQSHIQMNEYRDRVVLPNATKKYGRHIGTCIKILDMTGLRLSALNQIKLLTAISTIDDLNYPEKTETYYIVNVPYIFSACWKVVKPLLQERTRKKIQIMDYSSLPHFSRKEGSGSSRVAASGTTTNCFSLDHPLHQQLYNYVKQQADLEESASPLRQGSVHVDYPEPDPTDAKIMKTIESELHKLSDMKGLNKSFSRV
ncbi:Phosphatidylinositol/phosphatidylcholine transfer protein SFH2 [Linum perenne]